MFATPGSVAAGFGGITLLGADARSESSGAGIVAYSALLLGTGVAILGAGVYEGPLARYEMAP